MSNRHIMFVYGTLKTGQPNHHVLKELDNGVADYICKAETTDKWPLVIATKFNIPYLLNKKHNGKKICGELYAVDNRMMAKMDEFEGHPEFYTRLRIEVKINDHDLTMVNVWAYFITVFRPQLLNLNQYDNYDSYGQHGLKYVHGCEREDYRDEVVKIVAAVKIATSPKQNRYILRNIVQVDY